jgi:hypothetical protein
LTGPTGVQQFLTSTTGGVRGWSTVDTKAIQLNLQFANPTGPLATNNPTDLNSALSLINTFIGLLAPSAPGNFPNGTLTVPSVGRQPLLCSGPVVNNSSLTSDLTPGTSVSRTVGATASSSQMGSSDNTGPGDKGIITAVVDGVNSGSVDLSQLTTSSASSGVLTIANVQASPLGTPGFYKSFRAQIVNAPVSQGINSFQITDSAASNSNVAWFVTDNLDSLPVLALGTLVDPGGNTLEPSSGIDHYTTGSVVTVSGLTMSSIGGETYTGSTPISLLVSNGLSQAQNRSYSDIGITTPVARQTLAAQPLSDFSLTLDGTNSHNQALLTVTGTNVRGSATWSPSTRLLGMLGSSGSRVNEQQILGSTTLAQRVYLGATANTARPTLSLSGYATAWNSSQDLSAPGYQHEATVVGGLLSCDQTAYAGGYLPVNPRDYSVKPSTQYMSFAWSQPALSAFGLSVVGTYSEILVWLPGISDSSRLSPNALGGTWWTLSELYSGAGVPGHSGDNTAGCAVGSTAQGTSGNFSISFGPQSSSNSINNQIIVRIQLTAGQSISSLSISN